MKGFCVVLEIQRRGNLVAAWEGEMGVDARWTGSGKRSGRKEKKKESK